MTQVKTESSTYQLALAFEDGITRFVRCRETELMADAAYMNGINIPLDCTDGVCGTCKAFCESGDFEIGSYVEDALTDDERAAGFMLPCISKPRSDVVLQIACTSEAAKKKAATFVGTMVRLERLSATTVAFDVEIPNREELSFLPGQYVNIHVPGTEVTRSYSFSSDPGQERLSFLVKLTPGGAMSTYLDERAGVGDEITFTGPHGAFFLREATHPGLLLAGGTGLAPVLSMLRALRSSGSDRKMHLIYGVNTDDDVVELDTIRELTRDLPALTWDYCVTDPNSSAPNKGPDRPYVMSLITSGHLQEGEVAVYTCGPPPMVDAVRHHFADLGIEPVDFYFEKFALAAPAPDPAAPSATLEPAKAAPAVDEGRPLAIVASSAIRHLELLEAPDAPDARALGDQVMLPEVWPGTLAEFPELTEMGDLAYRIAGQTMLPGGAARGPAVVHPSLPVRAISPGGRGIGDQEMFPSLLSEIAPLTAAAPEDAVISTDGYQIGETHPDVHYSDAMFEARQALELAALELVIGKLSSQQLAGYQLLAESTVPWLDGDQFVDAAMWTETNGAFHDYLFVATGNRHLLGAYQALGLRGRMDEVLRNACWCHPQSAQDHLDIVAAFRAGDRDKVRDLFIAHSGRAIETMRRAIAEGRELVGQH